MNSSFLLRIIFLLAALVVVGSFSYTPKTQKITLNIATDDLVIKPAVIIDGKKLTTNNPQQAAQENPKTSQPKPITNNQKPVIEIPASAPTAPQPLTDNSQLITEAIPALPPFTQQDLEKIMHAVVRMRCGGTHGSGMVIRIENKRYVLTAAHLVANKIAAGQSNCDVIFPRKDDFGVFKETYYRIGKILLPEQTKTQYQTRAHDIAILEVLPLPSEDPVVFPDGQPFVNHTFCPATTLQDEILLIGYPVNAGTTLTPGGVISKFPGVVTQYSDIEGVEARAETQFSSGFAYYPKLRNNKDTSTYHPITVSASTNNFAGASGGLVFDVSKKCILGVNTATGVVNNVIYGISMNPAFPDIVNFLETAINQ